HVGHTDARVPCVPAGGPHARETDGTRGVCPRASHVSPGSPGHTLRTTPRTVPARRAHGTHGRTHATRVRTCATRAQTARDTGRVATHATRVARVAAPGSTRAPGKFSKSRKRRVGAGLTRGQTRARDGCTPHLRKFLSPQLFPSPIHTLRTTP